MRVAWLLVGVLLVVVAYGDGFSCVMEGDDCVCDGPDDCNCLPGTNCICRNDDSCYCNNAASCSCENYGSCYCGNSTSCKLSNDGDGYCRKDALVGTAVCNNFGQGSFYQLYCVDYPWNKAAANVDADYDLSYTQRQRYEDSMKCTQSILPAIIAPVMGAVFLIYTTLVLCCVCTSNSRELKKTVTKVEGKGVDMQKLRVKENTVGWLWIMFGVMTLAATIAIFVQKSYTVWPYGFIPLCFTLMFFTLYGSSELVMDPTDGDARINTYFCCGLLPCLRTRESLENISGARVTTQRGNKGSTLYVMIVERRVGGPFSITQGADNCVIQGKYDNATKITEWLGSYNRTGRGGTTRATNISDSTSEDAPASPPPPRAQPGKVKLKDKVKKASGNVRFCIHCGAKQAQGGKFCHKCGKDQTAAPSSSGSTSGGASGSQA